MWLGFLKTVKLSVCDQKFYTLPACCHNPTRIHLKIQYFLNLTFTPHFHPIFSYPESQSNVFITHQKIPPSLAHSLISHCAKELCLSITCFPIDGA
mmetsp:Transcript_3882/g.14668  ORF Transcript_3882/g.14668 Transcript_3882/m.14668 type:complete len:96 (-) Transcript_3882:9345-9632(-)